MRKLKLAAMLFIFLSSFGGMAFADDGSQPAEPTVPQVSVLENGAVTVDVGTPRNFGYQIGDSIPVIVVFELKHNSQARTDSPPVDPSSLLKDSATAPTAPPPIPLAVPEINIEGLKMGQLSSQPSDVELVGEPSIQRFTDGQKDYLRVEFYVTQFVTEQKDADGNPKREVTITADFGYAVNALPDGQPDWQTATTPAIQVGIVPVAGDNETLLREGDLSLKESTHAPFVYPMLFAGVLLTLPLLVSLVQLGYRGCKRPRQMSANEIFWKDVDPVIAAAQESGICKIEDYQKILYELRRRYGVSSLQLSEVLDALRAEPDYELVERVFSLEQNIFKEDGTISSDESDEFFAALQLLIPRH